MSPLQLGEPEPSKTGARLEFHDCSSLLMHKEQIMSLKTKVVRLDVRMVQPRQKVETRLQIWNNHSRCVGGAVIFHWALEKPQQEAEQFSKRTEGNCAFCPI